CAQPSRAFSAWPSSAPRLRIHDQPSPILCQATGPPSPVPPSTRRARSSPIRHFADFTNWNTPIDQPWFHARSAIPNAAVDLPLPGPVWTTSSGRLRRCRVVRPSSGTDTGFPRGMSGRLPVLVPAVASDDAAELAEGDQPRAEPGGEPPRQPEPDRAVLAVHDDRRGAREQGGRAVGFAPGDGAPGGGATIGGAAVGDDDQQRAARRVAQPLRPQHLGGPEQPGGQRRAAP